MRSFKHWTPRYIRDRVAWEVYQRRHPTRPWIDPTMVRLLETLILPEDRGIEWGSGRSTLWFASRMKSLISVESDPQWHASVRGKLDGAGATNVDYRLVELGDDASETSPYVRVIDEVPDGGLQFALVDGYVRDWCAIRAADKLAPGGILVLDNANIYLDHPTHSPASRYRSGDAGPTWARFRERVRGWRMAWTSSGVTDAAIWFKPA
jgi:predicted O-methyltransferase YrrM